jgi:aminoglycoside 6'-N-acetyltransferase I
MNIRAAREADAAAWEAMRCELWPDGAHEHGAEIAAFFAGQLEEPDAVFVAEDDTASLVAVEELAIRSDVPGAIGKRTAYVEGLYVVPEWRGRGVARQLLQVAKSWARENHCEAIASDRAERIIVVKNF